MSRCCPAPSAPITALVASGLPADTFVFLGFLPRKGRKDRAARAYRPRGSTFVLFESPHRLAKTLGELPAEAPVAVCRELTKLHEEVFRGTAGEAEEALLQAGRRGEIVLVVRGGTRAGIPGFDEVVERARGYI